MDETQPLKHTHTSTQAHTHTQACTDTHARTDITQEGSEPHPISFAGLFHTDELGVTHGNKFLRGHTWLKLLSQ